MDSSAQRPNCLLQKSEHRWVLDGQVLGPSICLSSLAATAIILHVFAVLPWQLITTSLSKAERFTKHRVQHRICRKTKMRGSQSICLRGSVAPCFHRNKDENKILQTLLRVATQDRAADVMIEREESRFFWLCHES